MNLRLQIWVTGTDLDVSGALAPLKTDESGCSAQVIPFLFFVPVTQFGICVKDCCFEEIWWKYVLKFLFF